MTHTVTHTRKCLKKIKDHRIENPVVFFALFLVSGNCFAFEALHHLRHNLAHGDCRSVLYLPGGVGISAERELGVEVSQHSGDGLDVHAVLQRCCGECMPELMKFQVWESRILQNLLWMFTTESGWYILPVLGDGKRQGLSGCLLCSVMSRSMASCGTDTNRTEFSTFGWERTHSPLGLRTYYLLTEIVL